MSAVPFRSSRLFDAKQRSDLAVGRKRRRREKRKNARARQGQMQNFNSNQTCHQTGIILRGENRSTFDDVQQHRSVQRRRTSDFASINNHNNSRSAFRRWIEARKVQRSAGVDRRVCLNVNRKSISPLSQSKWHKTINDGDRKQIQPADTLDRKHELRSNTSTSSFAH